MTVIEMGFFSEALGQQTQVSILLPEQKAGTQQGSFKTLWLLHGLMGNQTSWMRKSAIERYAEEYGIAVVMPCTDRGWYTDTAYGKNYFTFVTEELPRVCRSYFRGMSDKREDNIVAGLSMGGYGALKIALTYPERYGYCGALSGALDITRKGRPCDLEEWRSIFGFAMEDPSELAGSKHDLYALARKNSEEGKSFPEIYMWCGTEDGLIDANRRFDALLRELGVPHQAEYSEGDHTWPWWDLHIQDALKQFLG